MTAGPHMLLLGLRGSGKSAIARKLAGELNLPHLDLDERVCRAISAADATSAFAAYGEAGWREAEGRVLKEVLRHPDPAVIALGGGTPMASGVQDHLRQAAAEGRVVLVLLDVPPDLLQRRRAEDDGDRPALRPGETLSEEIARTYDERMPVYRLLADHIVGVDDPGETIHGTSARIRAALGF